MAPQGHGGGRPQEGKERDEDAGDGPGDHPHVSVSSRSVLQTENKLKYAAKRNVRKG